MGELVGELVGDGSCFWGGGGDLWTELSVCMFDCWGGGLGGGVG